MHFIKILGSAKFTRWAYFVVCHFIASKVDHVSATRLGPPLLNLFQNELKWIRMFVRMFKYSNVD